MFTNRRIYILLIMFLFSNTFFSGCKKYLEEKSDQQLIVPSTVKDLQSLLDNPRIDLSNPNSPDISADDYYLTSGSFDLLDEYQKRMYTWEKENLFSPGNNNDWVRCYNTVYTSNVVLYNIDKIKRVLNDENDWNNTKGSALFLRAKSFAQAAWIWALAYDENTSTTDLGIPLRLDPNFNTPSVRATVKQSYDQIIQDLKEAITLLPATSIHPLRPSRPAACGWLARVYLSMRKYDSALVYSDKALQFSHELMDYNFLPVSGYPIIRSFNPEVIYQSVMVQTINYNPRAKISPDLYALYTSNDLRKVVMYQLYSSNVYVFQGSYDGTSWIDSPFNGIASDELYLMRSECLARGGLTNKAMDDLNTLLIKRWKTGTFVPFTALNSADAIQKILLERRKEFYSRGLRWMDIKRLNKEGANIVLTRLLNGSTYTLPPNDLRYALPIPEDVISITKLQQNSR